VNTYNSTTSYEANKAATGAGIQNNRDLLDFMGSAGGTSNRTISQDGSVGRGGPGGSSLVFNASVPLSTEHRGANYRT
jgi:hypothetical protein